MSLTITNSGERIVFSLLATFVAVAMAGWSGQDFAWHQIAIISVLQFLLLVHPMHRVLSLYYINKDLLQPAIVASSTFIVFHMLLNPIAIANLDVFIMRGMLVSVTPEFMASVIMSYAVVAVAWFSYYVGSCLILRNTVEQSDMVVSSSVLSLAFLVIGGAYVGVGIIGNISVLGDFDIYVDKMLHFYERWETWEIANIHGGFKWIIMMKFLPAGLILLALGSWLYNGGGRARLFILLFIAAVANVFLSSATGGRGSTLMVAFYSIPLLNAYVKRFSVKMFIQFSGVLVLVSYMLGVMRAASYYNVMEGRSLINLFVSLDQVIAFIVRYLTNFVGTITLVNEVRQTGIIWGKTAFAGLTGLFGGLTPVTTELEVWWRLKGQYVTVNPRYGPPGELYLNFGWIGLIIGMILVGLVVAVLSRMYAKALSRKGISAGMIIVFTSFTAYFLVIANLSYIPAYFTFFSVPFYFVFLFFRNRLC